jgi:hypothetical protein
MPTYIHVRSQKYTTNELEQKTHINNNESQLTIYARKLRNASKCKVRKKNGKKVRKCISRWVMMLECHVVNVMKEVTMALECC